MGCHSQLGEVSVPKELAPKQGGPSEGHRRGERGQAEGGGQHQPSSSGSGGSSSEEAAAPRKQRQQGCLVPAPFYCIQGTRLLGDATQT